MYLSRIRLNIRNKRARHEIEDIYELHRTVMSAFPVKDKGGPGNVLFRLEFDSGSNTPQILIQSEMEPNWSQLNVDSNYLLFAPETKVFNPEFSNGQIFRFRLLANPTKKTAKKRLGLIREEDQLEWLDRKSKTNGFAITQLTTIPKGFINGKKKGSKMTFYSIQFEGILKVTDPMLLKQGMIEGIGSAKGMGFGLLSLAPYHD